MKFNWFAYLFNIIIADIYFVFYILMLIPAIVGLWYSVTRKMLSPSIIGILISAMVSYGVIGYADTAQEKRIEAKRQGFEHVNQKSIEQAEQEKEQAQKEAERERREQQEFEEWKAQREEQNSEEDSSTSDTEHDPVSILMAIILLGSIGIPATFALTGATFNAVRDSRSERKYQKRKLKEAQTTLENLERGLADLDQKYANAETSPETFLKRPLILDVTYPATAEFHRARKTARIALDTAKNSISTGNIPANLHELDQKIETAHRAWDTLWNEANKTGIPLIEGRKARLLQKHLNVILDESATQAERSLNAKALISLLDGIEHDLSKAGRKEYLPMLETMKKRATKAETLRILPAEHQLNDAIEA